MSNRLLNRSASLLLLMLSMLSLGALIAQTFALELNALWPLWVLIFCLLLWAAGTFRRLTIPALVLSALLIFAAVRLYAVDIRAELLDCLGHIRGVYYDHLTASHSFEPDGLYDHTAIVLFLLLLITNYLAFSLTAPRGRIFLSLLGDLPFFFGCIAVNGEPQPLIILAQSLFLILLLLSGDAYDENGGRGRIFWHCGIPAVLVLLLCLQLADPINYDFNDEDVALSRRVDRLMQSLSTLIHRPAVDPPKETLPPYKPPQNLPQIGSANWYVSGNALDMSSGRGWIDPEQVVLRVRASNDGCMYLRRCSYGDYAGNHWLVAPEYEGDSSLAFTAAAVAEETEEQTVEISLTGHSDLLLVPYFSSLEHGDDAFVRSDSEQTYTMRYYPYDGRVISLRLGGDKAEQEKVYREYVHKTYTALPEATAFSAQVILEDAGITLSDPDLIMKIAAFVQLSGEYDINTRAYPAYDYAIFFLTQSHRGYCIHFATAATVLYRAAGIPARLTDGYMFSTVAGETVDVLQADEHAWVEVYLDGLGWIPVEVTGGSGFYESGEGIGRPQWPSPYAPSVIPTAAPEATPVPTPTPSPVPTPTPAPTATPDPAGSPTASPEGNDPDSSNDDSHDCADLPAAPRRISPWLLLLLLPALGFLAREIRLFLRQRAIYRKDRRKSAVALWRESRALLRDETQMPREIRACAERAVFGRSAPGREELRAARAALRHLEQESFLQERGVRRLWLILRGRLFR